MLITFICTYHSKPLILQERKNLDIMDLARKQLYILYSKIAYGYVLNNYSKSFLDRVKDNIKAVYVKPTKATVEIHCKYTGNDFRIKIDLNKRSIEHRGCYSLNKAYNAKDLIDYNINQFNPHLNKSS